jgi:hypothetical protein
LRDKRYSTQRRKGRKDRKGCNAALDIATGVEARFSLPPSNAEMPQFDGPFAFFANFASLRLMLLTLEFEFI